MQENATRENKCRKIPKKKREQMYEKFQRERINVGKMPKKTEQMQENGKERE